VNRLAGTGTDRPGSEGTARSSEATLPTGPDKTAMVRSLFDAIAPRYDLVNRLITFGLDVRWRRRTAGALGLPSGSRVLDLACGTGDLVAILERTGLVPFGVDLSFGMLEAGHSGRPLLQADGEALPVADASVDGVTCGYALRNFTDLPAVFAELARVVRPGGRVAFLEVAEPERPLLRAGYRVWFTRCVPFIGGLVSDRDAYRYLPRSTAYLPATGELRSSLLDAGFSVVNRRLLWGGLSQVVTATRKGHE
jgi:demethylmenaquinone methyltransferase / 2-methoxy-6-polyprenyl-1,4-benzoquinol methylase